ncbi:MAG TPA: acetamidase [bacterium]|nr:acetamidase [bacterium]
MHFLRAVPENIHFGFYAADLKPVLVIQSGDTVQIETSRCDDVKNLQIDDSIKSEFAGAASKKAEGGPGPHTLTGPIYIEGAESGDVLEVHIQDVQLRCEYGVNRLIDSGVLADEFPEEKDIVVTRMDHKEKRVKDFFPGVSLPLRPFFGSMGVAPLPASGRMSSLPPGIHAGNLDIKDLVQGSTLYIPIQVKGALFSCGDGHACQADGEADGTGLETPLTGIFTFVINHDMKLKGPMAETPTHYMTIGFHKSLRTAARIAIREMVDFLTETKGLTREQAYALVSLVGDLHVSQLVNLLEGVRFLLPKNLFS